MTIYDDAEGVLQDQGLEVVVIPYRPSPPAKSKELRPPLAPSSPIPKQQAERRQSADDENDGSKINRRRRTSTSSSSTSYSRSLSSPPASEESKTTSSSSEGGLPLRLDNAGGTTALLHHRRVSSLPAPPPPPSPMMTDLTPRSRSVLEEAEEEASSSAAASLEVVLVPPSIPENQNTKTRKETNVGKKKPSQGAMTAANNSNNTPKKKFASHQGCSQSVQETTNKHKPTTTKYNKPSTTTTTTPPRRSRSTPVQSTTTSKRTTPPKSSSKKHQHKRDPNQKMGIVQMAKLGYQELCNAIIRPPRSDYPMEALGPEEFTFCNQTFVRKDFGVVNERGLVVECSMWKRVYEDEDDEVIGTLGGGGGGHNHQTEDCDLPQSPGGGNEGQQQHECGQITLNVDDWDENKEKGQMYLHVPESFDYASTTSSTLNDEDEDDEDEELDDGCDELIAQAESILHSESEEDNSSQADSTTMSEKQPKEQEQPTPRRRGAFSEENPHFHGTIKTRKRHRTPVVIYLHGNSSGRTEVVPQLGHLLSLGVSVVAFDFCGSGKSEGDYVSLGYYEREDLQTVVHHLRASGDVSTIALWGRSMGAATAIMYGSRDPTISCMILDSSFTDLTRLAEEMVEKGREQGVNVPNFVVSVALRMIKSSIKSQAGFSIRHISPISHVNRCFTPALFVAGEHDDFINKRHSEKLHAKYAGDKNIVIVDGDHNSPRPRFLLQSACLFLQSCMQLSPSLELVVPLGTNLLAPPWICPGILSRFGLGAAIAKARAEAASLSDGRSWLPINNGDGNKAKEKQKQQQQVQRRRSQPPPTKLSIEKKTDLPPGLPLDKSRSCTDAPTGESLAPSPTAADFLAPPDMSERQKEIQSSLFKMLGQHE